jgi:hypothetical protein
MDEMPVYEIRLSLEAAELRNRASWEQTRFIAYMIAQVNSRKKLKPTDILSFEWDKVEKGTAEIDPAEIERIKRVQDEIIKSYNDGGKRSNGHNA